MNEIHANTTVRLQSRTSLFQTSDSAWADFFTTRKRFVINLIKSAYLYLPAKNKFGIF